AAGFSHAPEICNQTRADHSLLTDSDFTNVDRLEGSPPAVQRRFKGQKYLLQLVSGGELLATTCFEFEGNLSESVPSPPGPNGFANQEEQPEGPGDYYVKVPSLAYFAHGHGQSDVAHEEYAKSLGFSACDGAAATVPECDRYTLTESSRFEIDFKWFPEAQLRREARNLERGAKPI
ncbi:MAG TPA: hypothetical protein VKG38_19510, partial [Solirubrobacteraceae bacterium]|nr:hypothetical protein [Solirubrobacteraceae bacterium]